MEKYDFMVDLFSPLKEFHVEEKKKQKQNKKKSQTQNNIKPKNPSTCRILNIFFPEKRLVFFMLLFCLLKS